MYIIRAEPPISGQRADASLGFKFYDADPNFFSEVKSPKFDIYLSL